MISFNVLILLQSLEISFGVPFLSSRLVSTIFLLNYCFSFTLIPILLYAVFSHKLHGWSFCLLILTNHIILLLLWFQRATTLCWVTKTRNLVVGPTVNWSNLAGVNQMSSMLYGSSSSLLGPELLVSWRKSFPQKFLSESRMIAWLIASSEGFDLRSLVENSRKQGLLSDNRRRANAPYSNFVFRKTLCTGLNLIYYPSLTEDFLVTISPTSK